MKPISNQLFSDVKAILLEGKQRAYSAINVAMVETYWLIGKRIVEEEQGGESRAKYGAGQLKALSTELKKEFGKGFSVRNIEQMRLLYLEYPISQTVSAKLLTPDFQLSWSHYLLLMRMNNKDERRFYEIEAISNTWSLNELKRQYNSALYTRLALSSNKEGVKALARQGQIIKTPGDAIKDPYILEFLDLPEHHNYSESELENELIDKLEHFLLELGKGFTFVSRQKRLTFDEKHFYVDLVFYNRLLRSFVLIDLKVGELTHGDIGQMQMYVNYYDRFVKTEDERKTVGIILCKNKSETLVEITLPEDNEQIFASRYQTILPSKEELKKLLTRSFGPACL
jgi:predicted nuclease of restriction endonuclease-like (RecB) superfamily